MPGTMLDVGDTEVNERTEPPRLLLKKKKSGFDFENTSLLYKCNTYPNILFEIKYNQNLSI